MTLRLMLYTHDWAPSVGGIQTVYTALANGFSAWSKTHAGENIEVTLVTQSPAEGMDDSRLTFAVVRRPGLRKLVDAIRSADVLHIAGPAILPLTIGWALRKPTLLEHHGYQSVCPNGLLIYGPDHSVCPGHFMAARYTKCVRCNSGSEGWAKSLRGVILTFARRWLAKRATVNVAPSRHNGRRIELPRTQVIHHGVPGTPLPVRSFSNNQEGAPACFAYVGRLVTEKGLPVLLRACRHLSRAGFGFHLKIVGDGPERSVLEETAQEFGIEVKTEFVGAVALEAMPELLVNAAAVIMPSVCEDVAPLVAIEQMMQGRLVIASDIGGLGETVDGVGLKFPAGDDRALAECMRKVLEDPGLARQLGEKAKQHALEAFTEERMVADHVRVYGEILGSQAKN
jgi:glycogen(starch) synthase